MLTLPIGHPWPTKASLTSCQAHAIFFNVLKSRVESHHFQVKKTNSFLPQNLFGLWPTATNVVVLRPHQTKRKPTAVPSLLFIRISLAAPQHFRSLQNNSCEKVAMGIDPAFNFVCSPLRPTLYSKE
jgi:hypothetical protein